MWPVECRPDVTSLMSFLHLGGGLIRTVDHGSIASGGAVFSHRSPATRRSRVIMVRVTDSLVFIGKAYPQAAMKWHR